MNDAAGITLPNGTKYTVRLLQQNNVWLFCNDF